MTKLYMENLENHRPCQSLISYIVGNGKPGQQIKENQGLNKSIINSFNYNLLN